MVQGLNLCCAHWYNSLMHKLWGFWGGINNHPAKTHLIFKDALGSLTLEHVSISSLSSLEWEENGNKGALWWSSSMRLLLLGYYS